ncbi:RNA pyrophosphohydrolase [compost metagenome]
MGYIADLGSKVEKEPIILAGSCVLLFNSEGQLLLQQRTDSSEWRIIEGAMKPGESLEETAARQLYEDTGLSAAAYHYVTILSDLSYNDAYHHDLQDADVYHVTAVFEAREVSGELKSQDCEIKQRYFCLKSPLPKLEPSTEYILIKAGYL